VSRINKLGWSQNITLEEGIKSVYKSVLEEGVFDN
ncbi:MAG: hypothetical protein ACI8Q1_003741, partial [Parvicella sp.]